MPIAAKRGCQYAGSLRHNDISFEFPNLFDDDGKIQIESNAEGKLLIQKLRDNPKLEDLADVRTGIMGFEYWKMEPIVEDGNPQAGYVKLFTNGNFAQYSDTWGMRGVDLFKKYYLKPIIKLDKNFINQNTINLFKTAPKIIVRGVSKRLAAIFDEDGAVLLVAVHSIIPTKTNLKYILGT